MQAWYQFDIANHVNVCTALKKMIQGVCVWGGGMWGVCGGVGGEGVKLPCERLSWDDRRFSGM